MNHTVSFEMAKKLKEAGWNQEGHFFFWDTEQGEMLLLCDKCMEREETSVAAPILTELLEALPQMDDYDITLSDDADMWELSYKNPYQLLTKYTNENPCDAAAELWLWAKEKGYVE